MLLTTNPFTKIQAVQQFMSTIPKSNILNRLPPEIDKTETELPRQTWRLLAQLRANKSPFLKTYLHHKDLITHPSPLCPLCKATQGPFTFSIVLKSLLI